MKRVRIAELKAHLAKHLRSVRSGHSVTVLDRDTPVALLVPYPREEGELRSRRPLRPLRDVRLPPPLPAPPDSLTALLEERRDRE